MRAFFLMIRRYFEDLFNQPRSFTKYEKKLLADNTALEDKIVGYLETIRQQKKEIDSIKRNEKLRITNSQFDIIAIHSESTCFEGDEYRAIQDELVKNIQENIINYIEFYNERDVCNNNNYTLYARLNIAKRRNNNYDEQN